MSGEIPNVKAKIIFEDAGASTTLDKVAQSATKAGAATKAVADSTKAASTNAGQFGSTVGLVAGSLGRLNGGLGQTIGVVGQSLGAFQSLATAGLGPLGLAFGVVSTVVTAATAIFGAHTEQLARAATAMDEITAASARYADQQRQTSLEMQAAAERMESSGLSLLTPEGRAAAREAARLSLAGSDRAREQREMADLIAEYEGQGMIRERRSGPRRKTLDELMGGGGAPISDLAGERSTDDTGLIGPGKDDIQARYAEEQELANERYQEQLDRNLAFLEKREAQEEESAERLKAINDSVFSAIESGLQSSVDAWLSGSATAGEAAMQMVKGVAKALTTEAIIQGLKETALGIGDAASFNYAGAAGHFAAAGTWAAVGVAAGAVGAVTGAFGGGGAAATPSASPQSGPALEGGSRERGGDVYNINWGSGALVYAADRAQLGRDLQDAIEAGRSRLDRST
jgi:hypothetical protein